MPLKVARQSGMTMQIEIEIKFFISQDIQQPLSNLLNLFDIASNGQIELGNVYFDTPALDLRRLDMGLRIRRSGIFSEQTIKCRGQVVGGLHARPEYNAPVKGVLPSLVDFPNEIWPSLVIRDDIQSRLTAQFRTDFLRRHWLIRFEGAEIELAWDQGEIVGSLGRSAINELELELKSGEPRALFVLAERLAGLGGVRLGAQSKAQRGYQLAGLGKPLTLQSLPEASEFNARARITLGLQHWQHHEQLWLESRDPSLQGEALLAARQGMALIVEAADVEEQDEPAWLPTLTELSSRLSSLAPASPGQQEALLALFHDGDYVRLQLAIAAWLHQGA